MLRVFPCKKILGQTDGKKFVTGVMLGFTKNGCKLWGIMHHNHNDTLKKNIIPKVYVLSDSNLYVPKLCTNKDM